MGFSLLRFRTVDAFTTTLWPLIVPVSSFRRDGVLFVVELRSPYRADFALLVASGQLVGVL